MSIWFLINIIVFLLFTWKFYQSTLMPHIIIGGTAFCLILFNWTRHAVFSTLRSKISRKRKIFFAKISKKVLPFHKWIGTTAYLLVCIHAFMVIQRYGFQFSNLKMLSGSIALLIISFVVLTGWWRLFRPSYPMRIAHLVFDFSLFVFIVLHVFL